MALVLRIVEHTGPFAENKDVAREIRTDRIIPLADDGTHFILDFKHVELSTQSFIHALLFEPLQKHKETLLDRIQFANCSPIIQELIRAVVDYTLNPSDALPYIPDLLQQARLEDFGFVFPVPVRTRERRSSRKGS